MLSHEARYAMDSKPSGSSKIRFLLGCPVAARASHEPLSICKEIPMKLYYSAGACSLAPHIVLEESGLPYEAVSAPTKTKELPDGSDYRKVNPLGYVPYLALDDGSGIRECAVIVQYIADQAPEKKLAPANGARAHYMRARLALSDGIPTITPFERQDSALLSILTEADALLIRPVDDPARKAGEMMDFIAI